MIKISNYFKMSLELSYKVYTIRPKRRINKNIGHIWIRQRFEKHQIG